MLSNVKPCNRFEFSHILSPPATSQFLHFSPVDQPFAKEVYFWSFMTKSYLSNPQNIQANVFSNFHRTVIYGKKPLKSLLIRHFSASKKIIFLEMPHFSPTLEPKKKYMQFYRPWCSSLNGLKSSTKLFIKNFFWWSSHFFAFEPPNKNLPKKVHAISTKTSKPGLVSPPPTHIKSSRRSL